MKPRPTSVLTLLMFGCFAAPVLAAAAPPAAGSGGGAPAADALSLAGKWLVNATGPGATAQVKEMPAAGSAPKAWELAYTLPGGKHQWAYAATEIAAPVSGVKAVKFAYSVTAPAGVTQGLGVLLREADGSEYLAKPDPPFSSDWKSVEIPLTAFSLAGWSKDENAQLDVDQVKRFVVGVRGTPSGEGGSGWLRVREASFVRGAGGAAPASPPAVIEKPAAPAKPADPVKPAPASAGKGGLLAGRWLVNSRSSEATAAVAETPEKGSGAKSWELTFTFQTGKHQWAYVANEVAGSAEGIKAVRVAYKGVAPAGIQPGIALILREADGSAYLVDPDPALTADWKTLEIPVSSFVLAKWSKDENGQLDLSQVKRLEIGIRGTASGDGGQGWLRVREAALSTTAPATAASR